MVHAPTPPRPLPASNQLPVRGDGSTRVYPHHPPSTLRSTGVLNYISASLRLPLKPEAGVLTRLVAAERIGRPGFVLPAPVPLDLVTPEPSHDPMLNGGTGIWTLEVHMESGLLFAGCWGSGTANIKCWVRGTNVASAYERACRSRVRVIATSCFTTRDLLSRTRAPSSRHLTAPPSPPPHLTAPTHPAPDCLAILPTCLLPLSHLPGHCDGWFHWVSPGALKGRARSQVRRPDALLLQ